MRRLAAGVVLAIAGLVWAQATHPLAAPASMPAGWAPGSDQPVAGITPILLNLWPGDAPNAVKGAPPDRDDGTGRIWAVNTPGLIIYLPPADKWPASGAPAIVACMGGSYTHLTRLVGADSTVAAFVPKGIAVISLKYRLKPPSTDPERDARLDGRRALRVVRAHAADWGINPHKVGILGWSAGGNLALNLSTHFDAGDPAAADPIERLSCRPDFAVMLSPWPNGHPATAYPAAKDSPPAYIGCAQDDRTAPFPFAQAVVDSWKTAGIPVQFHEVPTGGHGAFEIGAGTARDWPTQFLPWLEKSGFWKP